VRKGYGFLLTGVLDGVFDSVYDGVFIDESRIDFIGVSICP
jgi:hypothetical protein